MLFRMHPRNGSADIEPLLGRWLSTGIITDEQAERIRADMISESGRPPVQPAGGNPLVIEAMGYLGGAIVLVALGLVTGEVWSELNLAGRLSLSGGVTALLLVAGAAVPRDAGASGARLRGVVWFVASVTLSLFLAIVGADGFGWYRTNTALFAAGGTALASAGLWRWRPHLLQHIAVLASILVVAASATALLPFSGALPGLAVWASGAAWAVLAWGRVIMPSRPGMVLGTLATIVGAISILDKDWGTVLAMLTVIVLVLIAVAIRDLVLLAVAAVGTLIVLPAAISRYLPGVLSVAIVLLAVGALLVAAAVVTARRRRRDDGRAPGRDWSTGEPRSAIIGAGSIVAATTACILISTLA